MRDSVPDVARWQWHASWWCRRVMARIHLPGRLAIVVLMTLGCSNSSSSGGGGCGSSGLQRCGIDPTSTVCGDRITLECFEGAKPDAKSQCEKGLEQDTEAIYCCTNAAAE